jgi:methylenetetrahydrofolate--tRNA-(uracil-5-)-methyltransferase
VTHAEQKHFQPMKANFGILPELPEHIRDKRLRYGAYVQRAIDDMQAAIKALEDLYLAEVAA